MRSTRQQRPRMDADRAQIPSELIDPVNLLRHKLCNDTPAWTALGKIIRALEAPAALHSSVERVTYSSTQATDCAGCGKHKHTPLRIDAIGGYVCLTCIDAKIEELLGGVAMPIDEEVGHKMNAALCEFATRWKVDGDYLRCVNCDRPQLAGYAHMSFQHAAGCNARDEAQPWLELMTILEPISMRSDQSAKLMLEIAREDFKQLEAMIREPTCLRCGSKNADDAEKMCKPDGDDCPGCNFPLEQLWSLSAGHAPKDG